MITTAGEQMGRKGMQQKETNNTIHFLSLTSFHFETKEDQAEEEPPGKKRGKRECRKMRIDRDGIDGCSSVE